MNNLIPFGAILFSKPRDVPGTLLSLILYVVIALPASASGNGDLVQKLRLKYASCSSPAPIIGNIEYPKQPVGAYQKVEIAFELDATYKNPFDPDDINVEGHFIYPNGREVIVPAFFYDRYEPVNDKTTNTYLSTYYTHAGDSGWKIRFSSGVTGDYKFYITARDAEGQINKSEWNRFTITASSSKGYVRVSETNPRYFENSADGSLFYGTGSNIHAVIGSEPDKAKQNFEYYFEKAKGNFSSTRIWLCHWRWLEWTPDPEQSKSHTYGGINFYNQAISSNLDRIFNMAEEINLRIQLTLEDNQEHDPGEKYHSWKFNPYNVENGGPVANPDDYWSNPDVRVMYKKKLRYIVARWGYSASLWSLNQWNDMSNPNADQVNYLRDLHSYVHSIVDGWRPVIYGSNFGHEADRYMDYAIFGKSRETNKPGVTQECYYTSNPEWFSSVLQDQLWEGLFSGNAARMVWPHWEVDHSNAWLVFRNILNFVSDVPLNKKIWSPLKVSTKSSGSVSGQTSPRVIEVKGYGDIPSFGVKAPKNIFYINEKESSQFLEGFAAGSNYQGHVLYGNQMERLRNPPTLVINVPGKGAMLVRMKIISAGKHRLISQVNGEKGPSMEWNYAERTHVKGMSKDEEYLWIPLKKGENRILIDCDGPEYIRLASVYFILDTADPNGILNANGLISDSSDEAIIYLQNQTFTELYHTILEKEPAAVKNIQLEVSGLKDGEYHIVYYDPSKGDYAGVASAEAIHGKLSFQIHSVEKDLAIKIREITLPIETTVPFQPGWYKAQQHTHSVWSDGKHSITQNIKFARDHGFKVLVSTDHSTMVTEDEINPLMDEVLKNQKKDLLSIFGDEVSYNAKTDPANERHLLAIGLKDFIYHTHRQPQDIFNLCNEQGGLAFIAHPYNTPYNFKDWDAKGYHGVEVWNGADYNVFCNEGGVWTPTRNAISKWDELNCQGRRMVGVANADAHNDHQIDDLWTMVYLPSFTETDYLNSLAKGHAYGSNGPSIIFTVDGMTMGSDLAVPATGKDVSIYISGNSNNEHPITRVRLFKNGKPEQEWVNPGSAHFSTTISKEAKPGDFFRVTIECMVKVQSNGKEKNGVEYAAFTNPVWIISEE